MRVAVSDANIFFDLELAGLLDTYALLGIETHTSDLIVAELERGGHGEVLARLAAGVFRVHELNEDELSEVEELMASSAGGTSPGDCSVVYLAGKLDAMLLTGDRALVRVAGAREVVTHGIVSDAVGESVLLRT